MECRSKLLRYASMTAWTDSRGAVVSRVDQEQDVRLETVEAQLGDLASLLKEDFPRVKTEFGRLNLALKFTPVEGDPCAHYVVEGQCDLSALALSFVQAGRSRVPNGRLGDPLTMGAVLDLSREGAVHSRTPVLLRFRVRLPSVTAAGRGENAG